MTKTALITGATSGFGEAAARLFVADGWQVIGTGRRQERLDALAAELGDAFRPLRLDMRDLPAAAASVPSTCWSTMPASPRRSCRCRRPNGNRSRK